MTQQLCMRCYISGKVQGVWFRAATKEQAQKRNINGWVRNLSDGRVEVFACGIDNQLEQFYDWLKQGPPLAKVKECTRENRQWEHYPTFIIL